MTATAQQEVSVWDSFVRLFHWSIVTLFLLNFWLLEDGESAHEWVGYSIGGLLLARVLWGFFGTHNARFSSFFPTPNRLRVHAQELRQGSHDPAMGHNPLGGLMVLFLISMLALTVVSGWMQTLDQFWGVDWVEELHEWAANITMIAVVVHVSAVILMGRVLGIQLIRPMITGKRRVE